MKMKISVTLPKHRSNLLNGNTLSPLKYELNIQKRADIIFRTAHNTAAKISFSKTRGLTSLSFLVFSLCIQARMSMYGVIMVSSKERHTGARSTAITARHDAIHSAPLTVVAIMSTYEYTHTFNCV